MAKSKKASGSTAGKRINAVDTKGTNYTAPAVVRAQDGDDNDQLAALKAHFLASFGDDSLTAPTARAETDRKGKKKARETATETPASDDGRPQDEIDRLMAPSSSSSSRPRPRQSIKTHTPAAVAAAAPSRPAPQMVVFDGGGSSRGSHGDGIDDVDLSAKQNWKAFMNTRTANTEPEAMTSATEWIRERTEKKRQAAEEKRAKRADADAESDSEDDAGQLTNDRQLSHLLNTTLFAQPSKGKDTNKRDLSSHDTLSRILELSSSNHDRKGQTFGRGYGEKALRAQQLSKMPSKMRQGIREAAGERASKEVEKNRELGLLNSKYSRKILGQQVADATMTGKKATARDRDRGLATAGGNRFQNGTLHLDKKEMKRVLEDPPARGRSGKGRAGGGPASKKVRR